MKHKNMNGASIMFPLKANEKVEVGAIYELNAGVAQKVEGTPSGALFGVCIGGGHVEAGKIMLDIDPTSIFSEKYDEVPTIGTVVDGCKLVISVDTENATFAYILRKA